MAKAIAQGKPVLNINRETEAIMSAIVDGISIQDTKYRVLYQNAVTKKLMGAHEGELCYKAYENKNRICEGCPVARSFKDGKVHTSERNVTRDNKPLCVEITASPLKDAEGKIMAGIEVVRDITGRKNAEKALKESEEKYRTLVENSQSGVFIIQDAKVQFVNSTFAKMCGYAVKEVIGKDFRKFIAPEDRAMVADRYRRRQAGENIPSEYEFRMLRKDGKTRINVNMNVGLVNYRGRIASMGTVKDITRRKKAEDEQSETRQMMESIAEGIADGILMVSSDFKILWANQAILKQTGCKTEEIIGNYCYKVTHHLKEPCRPPTDMCPIEEARKTGAPATAVHKHLDKCGNEYFAEISVYPIKDEQGEITQFVHISRDITGRKKAEAELKKLNEELKSKVHELERFNKFSIGRELKMVELKEKIRELESRK